MARGRFGAPAVCAAMAAVFCVSPVQAATIQLGDSGWQASWDNSLDGFVDLAIDLVTDDAIFLEKSAEFIFPPGPGGFESINITFQQIAVDAVSQIVISDEILTNSTGADWGGFNMQLLDGGDATFNPGLSSGFNTSPFNNQSYSDGNTNFSVSGGVVSNGSVWFPGTGPGELYIDVNTADAAPFTVFTLKETPVPEPGTVGLLLGGAAVLLRRKK